MTTFVSKIVDHIDRLQLDYQNLTLVVPSQRMKAYLHAAIYKSKQRAVLAPRIVTIDHWIQDLMPIPIIEKTPLLFQLYNVFKDNPIEGEEATFDNFMSWAPLLLNDFEEIDRYLIPADQLFKNLHEIKVLESWDVNPENLSKGQQRFMTFWDKLKPYYYELEKRLEAKQVTTKGKSYRTIAHEIKRVFEDNKNAHFVFAGFNALSESEISIMQQLSKMGSADILLDSDSYYFKDTLHEAGVFQRVLCERLGVKELPFIEDRLANKDLNIHVVECPQFTSQAQVVGSELAKLSPAELNETLVLLADESLLSSIIKHLPAQISQANITVGLPLRQTSLKSWVDLLFRLQESFHRRGNTSVYYRDFIQYTHHPFVLGILTDEETKKIQDLETKIIAHNWNFLDLKKFDLGSRLEQLNKLIFTPWKQDWKLGISQIQSLNEQLDVWLAEENELERAVLRKFAESIIPLQNSLELEDVPVMSLTTFRNLFNTQWSNDTIAYFGNPLDGLQIMGLLETRGLDFKNIFVFGLNEGVMPPQNAINSVIPMDLRRYFQLPTPREKQGLFAHHFYRLLHQAERVLITYASSAETVGSSEPSRYIQQLELELAKINSRVLFKKSHYSGGNSERIEDTVIHSSEEVRKKLAELLENGVSFSMFDKYIKCPLDFYYRYVLGLGEENKVEEDIESNTLGTIIHAVLEELFTPYLPTFDSNGNKRSGRVVTIEDLKRMEKDIPLLVSKNFELHFADDPVIWESGTNHISFEIAKEMVNNVLRREIHILRDNPDKSLFIIALEERLETELEVQLNHSNETIRMKLKGFCDRIDQFDGKHRIIDYKSGKVEEKHVSISKSEVDLRLIWDEIIDRQRKGKPDSKHVLQLLTYSYLYYKTTGKITNQAGIFSFKSIKESPFFLSIPENITMPELLDGYEYFLSRLVSDMLNPHTVFEHNSKAQYCTYCK